MKWANDSIKARKLNIGEVFTVNCVRKAKSKFLDCPAILLDVTTVDGAIETVFAPNSFCRFVDSQGTEDAQIIGTTFEVCVREVNGQLSKYLESK